MRVPPKPRIVVTARDADTSHERFAIDSANGSGIQRLTTNTFADGSADWGAGKPTCTKTINGANDPLLGIAGSDVLCGDNRPNRLNGGGGGDSCSASAAMTP